MSIQSISYLKDKFGCNMRPTQKDFIDLIDTLSYLPNEFCDKTPLFNVIKECSTTGITLSGSLYITNALFAADSFFVNLSATNLQFSGVIPIDSNVVTLTASNLFLTVTVNGSAFALPLYMY